MVVYLFVGDRFGICCKLVVNKKKMLVNFENCLNKNLGRKVVILYLVVDMWLLMYLFVVFVGGLLRWMIWGLSVDGLGFDCLKLNLKFFLFFGGGVFFLVFLGLGFGFVCDFVSGRFIFEYFWFILSLFFIFLSKLLFRFRILLWFFVLVVVVELVLGVFLVW